MPAPSRLAQFRALLARAATELNCKRSDDRAQRLATVRLQRRAIREQQQVELLSGRMSDPTKLLDADARLAEEEQRLAPAAGVGAVTVNILPVRYCPRCKAEVAAEPPPVVELQLPAPVEAKPEGSNPKLPANVVPIKRSVHDGGPLKR
jgi:hypothetical protein